MRKFLTFLVISNLLTGCIYADGCLYTPQMVNCVDKGKSFPAIARYQKRNSVGFTNSNIRWDDAVSCGAQRGDDTLKSIIVYNPNGSLNADYQQRFHNCMENKGYIILKPADGGYQNPKGDKGPCNL